METETRLQLGFSAVLFLVLLFAFVWATRSGWRFYSALMPMVFSGFGTLVAGIVLIRDYRRAKTERGIQGPMDPEDRVSDMLPTMAKFFVWLGLFYVGVLLIGFLPTIPLAIVGYMRAIGGMRWRPTVLTAASVVVLIYLVYQELIHIAWYQPLFLDVF